MNTSRIVPTRSLVVVTVLVMLVAVTATDAKGALQAAATSPTSITLNWTAPGDDGNTGTAAQYDIRYSTSAITSANWASATQVSNEPAPRVAGTAETFEVTGLTPNTSYYFAIKVSDEVGNWSALSNVVNKSTPQETTAPSAIANLAAPTATATAVTLTWTAPGDDANAGTAAAYDIRFSTSAITTANWASATQASNEPAPKAAGQNETFTVSGLTTGQTYYFAIKTADEVPNWSLLSNVVSKATGAETTAPAAVANLVTSASTSTTVSLTWTAPGDDGTTGTASQYDIRYSTAAITAANFNSATAVSGETAPKAAGQAEAFTVTGLTAGTTYYFALKTADEVPNWSAISNVPSRATSSETTAPATVANLTTTGSTSNSVTLTWTAPGDDGTTGTATTYDLRYSTSAITASNFASATQATGEPSPKAAGQAETFTVSGLNATTTYYFALKTADEVPNWSAISNVPSRATGAEAVAPAAIANLGASNETSNSITLSWTAPGDDGNTGRAAQYDIRYSTSAITTSNWDSAIEVSGETTPRAAGQSESFEVTNLDPTTTYYFAIKTADEVPNWSALSNVVSRATSGDATPPKGVTDMIVVSATDTSVTLSWTVSGDDYNLKRAWAYDFRYSTNPITELTWPDIIQLEDEPTPNAAGTVQSYTISGLTPGTTYYFAMKTSDEVPNWSPLSNVVSRTTAGDGTPPDPINDLSALPGDNEGQLILGWTATGDDGSVGSATAYTIWLAESELTDSTWTSGQPYVGSPVPLPSGSSHSYTLTGLVPGQRYWVGIVTYDELGNSSGISNIVNAESKIDIGTGGEETVADVAYPLPNTVLKTSKPELAVNNAAAAPGATYFFEVAADSQFSSLVADAAVDEDPDGTTEWKVDKPLKGSSVFYWRVKADDYPYSEVSSFIVNASTHPYPNPAQLTQHPIITFTDVPDGADLILLSPSGEQVRFWADISGGDLLWDGTNSSGNQVSSGTYLWFVPDSDIRGKIIVVR